MKGIKYYKAEMFNMIEVKTCSNYLHAYKEHLHQELSIGYINNGATILNVIGKDYCIRAGEAVIIYPYVSHRCQPVDINNWEYTMIYIDADLSKEILHNLNIKNSIGIRKLGKREFDQIKALSNTLKSNTSQFDKEVELIDTLIQLFCTCDIDIELKSCEKIGSVKTYIEEHFLETLQLKDMEQRFNINRFVLIRNFRRNFNTTPNAYQLQLKVNYGKQLLKSSGNIVDIALGSGFYDQAHFAKEFKKAYGVTPLQYHKDLQG